MSVTVKISRVSFREYSFRLSSRDGIRYVARALTFDNPSPFAYSRKIEKFDRRKLTFPVGMLSTLLEDLTRRKITYELTDWEWDWPDGVEIDGRLTGDYEHQSEAVRAFMKRHIGIIVVPTRGGKTFIASEIIRIWLATESAGQLLFCVDNTTLFTQAVDDIRKYFSSYGGIDIGEIRAGYADLTKRVTVGMIQSIQSLLSARNKDTAKKKEMERFLKGLNFLCVDEVHDNCSDSKLKLYRKCRNLEYQLCLSATPYRTGAFVQNLKLRAWSGDVVYEISEDVLRERGVLSDYKVFMLLVDHNSMDYPELDEYDYADCRRKLIFENRFRNDILGAVIRLFQKLELKTLVLFQSVEHGRAVSEAMGIPFLSGESTAAEREAEKNKFLSVERGGVLLASNIFKKGVTLPQVEVLLNADEGLEDANTIQRKGRTLGATATKKRSLVIDFFDFYDAYLSEHSEARLNTYVEAVGEDKVGIIDVSADGWLKLLEKWCRAWFDKAE